jgi:hypothetical protein
MMVFEIPDDAWSEDFTEFLKKDADFAKIFPSKEQREALILIVERIVKMMDFHVNEDKNPHDETLGQSLSQTDAKLRNHRHDLNKTFSSKAEF